MTKSNENNKLNALLCTGVSALVLSACMPDDEAQDKRAEAQHDSAKIAHYSQAFQQYSARSLNAIVNSDLWASQTLPEGSLTLTSSAFGSLDLGGSEAYVQSAYCVIAGTPRHLTWFETENADGSLFLQGLGAERAGESASKLREMIARENFGIAGGDSIAMADGSVLDPVGGCNALNIPDGSVVAVVPIPVPTQVAETQEKYIMRALDCPADTEGNRLERIMATYMPSGNISVGASSFATEAAVMADNGLAWESLANNCLAPSEAIARVIVDTQIDALDVANIINIPGEITAALDKNLTDKTCKDVHDKKDSGEELSDEETKMYDTCAGPVELNPLTGIEYDDNDLVKEEEEIIHGECGGEAGVSKTITISAPGSANFKGIPKDLAQKRGQITTSDWTGDSTYRKITRFYKIVEDFGNGTGRGGASIDGNCDNGGCSTREIVTYEAQKLTCTRKETLNITCNEMYPEVAKIKPTETAGSTNLGWFETRQIETAVPALARFGNENRNFGLGLGEGDTSSKIIDDRFEITLIAEGSDNNAPLYMITDLQNNQEVSAGGVSITSARGGSLAAQTQINTNISVVKNDALDFKRNRKISGWADVNTLTPNKADDKSWVQGKMNCIWQENRNVHIPCQNGWTGTGGNQVDARQFSATSPTNGKWSGWSIVSEAAMNCSPPQGSGDSTGSNGGGNSGGGDTGGSNCLVAGTLIAMADGSTRRVETLEVGDNTLTGRVLQKYIRTYDETWAQTEDGMIMTQYGLLEYDGIIATGRHPFYINGQWTSMADIPQASKIDGSDVPVVYNMLMENNIIPVIGEGGTLYYASDDLNNWNNASERGRLKLLSDDRKIA